MDMRLASMIPVLSPELTAPIENSTNSSAVSSLRFKNEFTYTLPPNNPSKKTIPNIPNIEGIYENNA